MFCNLFMRNCSFFGFSGQMQCLSTEIHFQIIVFSDRDIAMQDKILIVEDSIALSMLLKTRLSADTTANVFHCDTLKDAQILIERHRFTLALTGLNLPDAPNGEILTALEKRNVPTIVFTGTVDDTARLHYAERKIIDYIVKDTHRTVETVVKTVERILTNRQFSILVVDDARAARSSLVEILARQNFTVREAHSGAQALEILASEPSIQLVITDYLMPDMDGHELTRRIRLSRTSQDLRIVGVSASTDRMLSAQFLKAGASDFIYRPFVPEELQCRIDNNIETLKQLMRLRQLADRDDLTGLSNRRSFFDQANAFLETMKAQGDQSTGGAVAILDIDYFKKINDTLGHEAGDRALTKLARLLSDLCTPHGHLVARLGGEEFGLLLKGLSGEQAYDFCEAMREAVEKNGMYFSICDVALTISIGVVEIESNEPIGNQLTAADRLLYMAKENGRNRVYPDPVITQARAKGGRR